MINYKKLIQPAIILILTIALILSLRGCRDNDADGTKTITIKVPAVSGHSDTIYKPIPYNVVKDSLVYKDSVIVTEAPFDKELADKFTKLTNDYDKVNAYLKSIATNEYNIPYEDSLVKIDNYIKTQGKILSFQQNYKLKERELQIDVPEPKKKINIYLGSGVSNNVEFSNFAVEANIGLQARNGNIYEVAYDNRGNIGLRYKIKL